MVTASFVGSGPRSDGYIGRCCFGVEEAVIPIRSEGVPVGFISVTGYSTDRERTRLAAEKRFARTGLRPDGYEDALASLNPVLPDLDLCRRLLKPAADLLGLICVRGRYRNDMREYSYRATISFIDEHYSEPLSVSRISALLNCSDSYVNHMFKKRSGRSFCEYVNEVRIKKACELLRSAAQPIRDVALAVGFNDTNYFSGVFRRLKGCTPSDYRRKYRQE